MSFNIFSSVHLYRGDQYYFLELKYNLEFNLELFAYLEVVQMLYIPDVE